MRRLKKIIVAVCTVAMVPFFGTNLRKPIETNAQTAPRKVNLGTEVLQNTSGSWDASSGAVLYIANSMNSDKASMGFRVLNYSNGKIFLDAEDTMGKQEFEMVDLTNWWKNGSAKWLENEYYSGFSKYDKAMIAESSLAAKNYGTASFESNYSTVDKMTDTAGKAHVFALSKGEIDKYYKSSNLKMKSGDTYQLRTAGKIDSAKVLVTIDENGEKSSVGNGYEFSNTSVSPAMNILAGKIAFTKEYKYSADSFTKVSNSSGNKWIAAVYTGDSSFTAKRTDSNMINKANGGTVSLSISATNKYGYDRVSAMLVDSGKNVLYYGKIAGAGATGASIKIPAGLAEATYTLYVFKENAGGGESSAYVSNMKAISVEVCKPEKIDSSYFTIDGELGDNGYYKGTVTVTAKDGYSISADGKTYSQSFEVSKAAENVVTYIKNTKTNYLQKILIPSIKIDGDEPVIDGAADKDIIYDKEAVLNIKDEISGIKSIKINDVEQKAVIGENTIKLPLPNGIEQSVIEVTDRAGNIKTITVSVAKGWMKEGIVPVGEEIALIKDMKYVLPEGDCWMVDNDNTVFVGGNDFYVAADSKITFKKAE